MFRALRLRLVEYEYSRKDADDVHAGVAGCLGMRLLASHHKPLEGILQAANLSLMYLINPFRKS